MSPGYPSWDPDTDQSRDRSQVPLPSPECASPFHDMSYTRTFPIAFALKGPSTTHKIYKMDLIPSDTVLASPTSAFHHHFKSALEVEIVSISGTLTIPFIEKDKPQPFGCIAVVGSDNSAASVHALAVRSGVVFAGSSRTFAFDDNAGVDRKLKGVFGPGSRASIHIGIAAGYDAKADDLVFVSGQIELRFTGESNASLYAASFPDPTA